MDIEENYILYSYIKWLRCIKKGPIEGIKICRPTLEDWKDYFEYKPQKIDLILKEYTNDGIHNSIDTSENHSEFKKESSRLEYDNLKTRREIIKTILEEIESLLFEINN